MKRFPLLRMWRLESLALVLSLVTAHSQASGYGTPGWKLDGYSSGRDYARPLECVDIPKDLQLCQGVGYSQMLLPNLLEQESLAEVRLQAGSWVPLVLKGCHPGTQVLLCSLFAPVCLERPVPPCRWLCEAVRDGCLPVLEGFGYPWPDMLACDKFPQDDVCILNTTGNGTQTSFTGPSPICPSCDTENKMEVILEHLCASDFALKAQVKEVRREGSGLRVLLEKRRRLLRKGSLRKRDLKRLELLLQEGAHCPCPQLERLGLPYLLTGVRGGQQPLLTGIHAWDRTSAPFRRALRAYRRNQCPPSQTGSK
ncbi:hypothetical protein COCON_G00163070 [Conger conger]|uniref:Secreted frizzled-related protein 1 n=1 Tax=Conger conger TaxID=82655 RepID=A0A9Q1HSY7_CONCO|nr:secreted frizzled-related protein 1-like [Conger conger]KAJ8260584.1 hypothetical protein COCON_G00163070 [Conger conger]